MSWYTAPPLPSHSPSCPSGWDTAPSLLCLQRTAKKSSEAQREELGVTLYGAQQQLGQLQVELERSHKRCSQAAAARQQLEQELHSLRAAHKETCHCTEQERKTGDPGGPASVFQF